MPPWCCILLSLFVVVITDGQLRTERCIQQDVQLKCNGLVPKVIPPNVTSVYIQEYMGPVNILNQSVFHGPGWSLVTNLHFHNRLRYSIGNHTFSQLSRLTRLKINANLHTFAKNAFVGLDSLKVLDLSGCVSLRVSSLVSALNTKHVLPFIDTLLLESVGSKFNRVIQLKRDFFDMLRKKNITTLSLANTNAYAQSEDVMYEDSRPLPLLHANMSHMNRFSFWKRDVFKYVFKHLRVIDISGLQYRKNIHSKQGHYYKECSVDKSLTPFLMRMEQFYANNLRVTPQFSIKNRTINYTMCSVNLKLMHLRQCNIHVFDASIYWPMDAPKLDMDISSNGMVFFYVRGYIPVFKLNLSRNKLYQMETHPDFVEAFRAFPFLEDLELDSNGLHNLPRDIFLYNTRLLRIGLRKNYLTTLSFDVRPLKGLSILDLNQNMVAGLDKERVLLIRDLQQSQEIHNKTAVLKVDFRQNDIKCSCQNHEFSRWISTRHQYIQDPVYNLSCRLDTDHFIQIDEKALEIISGICKQTLIKVVLLSTFFVIVVLSVFAVFLWRRYVKKSEVDWFIEQFKNRKTQEQYLALISHSNRDRDIVFNHIRYQLEGSLRRIVPAEFNLICLGDTHFIPGRSIVDEIHRTVSESCVVIFVISQAFCESGYCLHEMKEAYAQNKPIILVFLEEIDEQMMSPLMNSIFTSFSRVKITMEHGNVVFTPTCDSISQSIIISAVNEINRTAFSSCCRKMCRGEYRIVQPNI